MDHSRLSRNRTTVVQLLVTPLLFAGTLLVNTGVAVGQQTLPQGFSVIQPGPDQCVAAVSQVTEAAQGIKDACGDDSSCLQKVVDCDYRDNSIADASLSGESLAQSCKSIVNSSCPEMNTSTPSELRQEKNDASQVRKAATQQRDSAMDKNQDSESKAMEAQNAAMEKMTQLRKEYRDKVQELQRQFDEETKNSKDSKLKALKEAQEGLAKIDEQFIDLRDKLRLAQVDKNNIELKWKTDCRAAAYAASQKVENDWVARMQAEDKLAPTAINNQSSNLFGLRYRKLAKGRTAIALKYAEIWKQCVAGNVSPGTEAKVKVDELTQKVAAFQAKAAELDQLWKNQKLAIQSQLQEIQKTSDEQLQKATQRYQQDLTNADQDYQDGMRLAQQQLALAQSQAKKAQDQNLQNVETADRDMRQAMRDEAMASNRLVCAPAAAAATKSVSDIKEARKKAAAAKGVCQAMNYACKSVAASQMKSQAIDGQSLAANDCNSILSALNNGSGSATRKSQNAGAGAR